MNWRWLLDPLRFLSTAFDPRRCFSVERQRIVQLGCGQVALKEPAQVIAPAVEPELHRAPVDGDLHLRWAGERKADVGPAGGFLGGHLTQFLPNFVQRHWSLFNQDRANISKIDVSSTVTLKDHKVSGIWREVDPLRSGYAHQGSSAGLDQKRSERTIGYLFMNLFNHTRY
jgi:hypothetical protein